jgi:hypothetical protein
MVVTLLDGTKKDLHYSIVVQLMKSGGLKQNFEAKTEEKQPVKVGRKPKTK